MPKPESRSCSKSIRSLEHPCPNHSNVRVPRACGHRKHGDMNETIANILYYTIYIYIHTICGKYIGIMEKKIETTIVDYRK